jgi:hypothetical protein
LRVVEYKKIDSEKHSDEIGFIAQEVKEVIPESIDTYFGFIPNIYKSVSFTKKDKDIYIYRFI